MRVALGIPHTPWVPERAASLARLEHALMADYDDGPVAMRVFGERAPNPVWAAQMWQWGAEQKATHFLTLQDDVIVAPNFWPALRAMIAACPDQVICLETVHPAVRALADEGGHRWCTTADALIGVGYVMPTGLLRAFLRWRGDALKEGAIEAVTEDTLIALWCLATGRRIWHPIPTIIDHDTSIPSTYTNDGHPHRRPPITWRDVRDPAALEAPEFWSDTPRPVVHLGRIYEASPTLARQWVKGFGRNEYLAARADNGLAEIRRLAHAARAKSAEPPKARILVCTPTKGTTHPTYNASIWKLAAAEVVDVDLAFEVVAAWQWDQDIVRVRSRFVRTFLEETTATHLLFVDGDVSFDPALVLNMIALGRDYVAAPYPRRGVIDFEAVANVDGRPAEARAYTWAIKRDLTKGGEIDEQGCVEVAGLGLGCTLLSRACLERMTERYRAEGYGLAFDDKIGGAVHPTVALFQLAIRDGELLSEDHSLAARWREMGGKVWMFLGPGSPATHHGDHAYHGLIESFGIRRVGGR